MIAGRLQTRTSEDIEVRALSGCQWRVIDRRIARNNALCLVGFINKNHGRYEVMEFLDPVERTVFPSLEGAISSFVNSPSTIIDRSLSEKTNRTFI